MPPTREKAAPTLPPIPNKRSQLVSTKAKKTSFSKTKILHKTYTPKANKTVKIHRDQGTKISLNLVPKKLPNLNYPQKNTTTTQKKPKAKTNIMNKIMKKSKDKKSPISKVFTCIKKINNTLQASYKTVFKDPMLIRETRL